MRYALTILAALLLTGGATRSHFRDATPSNYINGSGAAAGPIYLGDDEPIYWGDQDCWLEWGTTGTDHLALICTDVDGVGTNGTIWYVNTGTDDLVYGGTITLPATGLIVGSSTPFSDSSGTLTLQNVDALDATTEATIEAAIDTLAGLTCAEDLNMLGYDIVDPTYVYSTSPVTDAAPVGIMLHAGDAYPQATANTIGSDVKGCGGVGRRLYTMVSNVAGAVTVTTTLDGTAVALASTTHFALGSDDTAAQLAVTATNLAAALNANGTFNAKAVATASTKYVYITPLYNLCTLMIATNQSGRISVTKGNDGGLMIGSGSAAAPGLGFAADRDTGIYMVADGYLAITTAGVYRILVSSVGVGLAVSMDTGGQKIYDSTDQISLGTVCVDGHSQATGDVCVGGGFQVDGTTWFDGAVNAKTVAYVVPTTATVTANAAAISWANGDVQVVDLQGSTNTVTITMTNPHVGGLLLKIIQGDNGDDITLSPAALTIGGAGLLPVTVANDSVDYLTFHYDGTSYVVLSQAQDIK